MLEFIRQLESGYRRVMESCHDADQRMVLETHLAEIQIAEAALHRLVLSSPEQQSTVQLAVLGPTQAGKSTTVNLLLQDEQAGVSPLAGYTVHPQGFAVNVPEQQLSWLQTYFEGFSKVEPGVRGQPDDKSFTVSSISANTHHPLNQVITWDTPDFDSLGAALYQEGVLKTAALADVILLVLSKDKYADQSVWDMMKMLETLACPTVVCLNKVTQDAETVLINSLKDKWKQVRSDKPVDIVSFPYHKSGLSVDAVEKELAGLYKTLQKSAVKLDLKKREKHALSFIRLHFDAWVEPVVAEHRLYTQWEQLLQDKATAALGMYHRDYLNHPQHYETFNKALAELLTLLELPGVAKALAKLRKVVTWPVRQLLQIGKRSIPGAEDIESLETRILGQVSDHFFIQLGEALLQKSEQDQRHADWWRDMNRRLREQRQSVETLFAGAIQDYHRSFQDDIHRTAFSLYNKLQEHPATLNSLRTTRVATDAAALALALHTGGIGVQDFVIAPAVLSITSMMTEGALGQHMNRLANKLKKTQKEVVKQALFDGLLVKQLNDLPSSIHSGKQFNIPASVVDDAKNKLGNSRYGLQLF
ncbi:MAG: GTPase domain-containing protein [Gammaproteobacteria bacterium]|nr:GTPase domain-containing protein [Gammaproteobacteria bacterium]